MICDYYVIIIGYSLGSAAGNIYCNGLQTEVSKGHSHRLGVLQTMVCVI